jgi:hypothetical protein
VIQDRSRGDDAIIADRDMPMFVIVIPLVILGYLILAANGLI